MYSHLTTALRVLDLILNFLFLQCGYLGVLVYYFISSKYWYLKNLSYSKKHPHLSHLRTEANAGLLLAEKPNLPRRMMRVL